MLSTHPDLSSIVRPAWFTSEPVRVVLEDAALEASRRETTARMRTAGEPVETIAAVRTMYKRVGIDPTKTRPSSEALLRRVRKGDELPRINTLVDIINWCSLETQLPYGLYDLGKIQGPVALRIGLPGEEYEGIRKATVHVAERLTLADSAGPFGNPTSDSARTMVTPETTRALVVIFAPVSIKDADTARAIQLTQDRIARFASQTA